MGHDAAGGDHRIMSDVHSLEDDGSITQPCAVAEHDGLASGVPALVIYATEISVHHHHVCSDQAIVPNLDMGAGDQRTAIVDEDVVPDLEVPTW